MNIENSDTMNEIRELKAKIIQRDIMLKDKLWQLRQIYAMDSWKLLTLLTKLKRQANIYLKNIFRFFILSFLFIFTVIITIYLSILKQWRKTVIFPGG